MATHRLTFSEAIVEALAEEMRRDANVFLIGQDIGPFGGSMRGAKGLWEEFGPARVMDAPISESAMAGSGVGAALVGTRPVVELSFGEFLPTMMSCLVCHAASMRYATGGETSVPLVVRARVGDGPYRGHPQSYEAWLTHIPGLKVVMPSTPRDAKGLMKSAIRDDNPVIFFEQMYLYHGVHEEVPDGDYTIPIGVADVKREGSDVTVVATAWMVHKALRAAEQLAGEGIGVEVLDPRTLAPLDHATLLASVEKTRRLVVVHEAWKVGGFGAEVASVVAEALGMDLLGPITRVGAKHLPIPAHQPLRRKVLPDVEDIVAAVRRVMA